MALYKQYKKATKRACIDLLETYSQCVILASNPNLTEEIYDTSKLNIVFLKIKITNIRNIIAKISPNLEISDASISSTIFIGKNRH